MSESFWPELSTLYLPEHFPAGHHACHPGGTPVPDSHHDDAQALLHECKKARHEEFLVQYRGVFFRGAHLQTLSGGLYVLRRMPGAVWALPDVGYPQRVNAYLRHQRHNAGGLWIICGMPGAGKSTATGAIVVDRLHHHGGVALTVEDPPEMPLEGRHGTGFCYQIPVTAEHSFADQIRASMRAYPVSAPHILLIGEVRDAQAATLALRSAMDGRLVVVTLHARDIIAGLERMVSLASTRMDAAREVMAETLRLVIHQRLVRNRTGVLTLQGQYLLDTRAAVGVIGKPDAALKNLSTEIARQQGLIEAGESIGVRALASV